MHAGTQSTSSFSSSIHNDSTNRHSMTINSASSSQNPTIHAVNRSSELLACARTALEILQDDKHNDAASNPDTSLNDKHNIISQKSSALHLFEHIQNDGSMLASLQKDALQILSLSDSNLQTLSALVRRRGHTNDPTFEMQQTIQQFQTYMKELHDISTSISTHGAGPLPVANVSNGSLRRSRGAGKQRKRHYELVALWLQNCGKDRTIQFQKAKDMRGEVLKAQVRRRKLLEGSKGPKPPTPQVSSNNMSLNASTAKAVATGNAIAKSRNISKTKLSQMNSPLFTMTTSTPVAVAPTSVSSGSSSVSTQRMNGHLNGGSKKISKPPTSHSSSIPPSSKDKSASSSYGSYYGNNTYGGMYGQSYGGGYGGVSGGYQDGMRRRNTTSQSQHANNSTNHQNPQNNNIQQQQQQQQQYTQRTKTKQRLEEARKAERSIAELTQIFGKMASLVSAQEEVIENIEYDVENSYMETEAASKEIGKLYDMKQGNRGLILKTFGILIFMIVFMRFF